MLCIAAFIVLVILGIFSGFYRNLAKKAWHCVWLRVRLKPCDTDFSQEVKNRLLAKLILTHPGLVKFLDRWLDFLAFLFVALTIISLVWVLWGSINLFVYDTCTPDSPQSCSLSGEACSINSGRTSFWQAMAHGQIIAWSKDEWNSIGDTFSRIPDRLKLWQPREYVSTTATYYSAFDQNKKTALEIIDPNCLYCANLFQNIKTAGFENRYNLTYLVFPIPKPEGGYKFSYSYLIASFMEAAKILEPEKSKASVPADWQILEKVFIGTDESGNKYQDEFNYIYNDQQARAALDKILLGIGYSQSQLEQIANISQSEEVKNRLDEQKNIVENKIRTVKIPTIIFDGRRFDRLIGPDKLK